MYERASICKLHALAQEDNALKVIKREFADPAKRRKAYAQHGLIRWVAALFPLCTSSVLQAKSHIAAAA